MSRKCRHPRRQRQTINHADWSCLYDCNICRACGEWLSLGPSNDASEAVQVEIRAAEIAADNRARMTLTEYDGWNFATRDGHEPALWAEAGYLARIIHDHTEGE